MIAPAVLDKAKAILGTGHRAEAILTLENGQRKRLRLFKSADGDTCYCARRRRNRGYRLSEVSTFEFGNCPVVDIRGVIKVKSEAKKWEDALKKILGRLEKSGLWPIIREEVELALSIGYEKMRAAQRINLAFGCSEEDRKKAVEAIPDPRLLVVDNDGVMRVKCSMIDHYSKIPIVKKMWFSKRPETNKHVLDSFKKALAEKKEYSYDGQARYDVSLEYAPQKGNKAWYAEEFRGCGNGHYYLVIDETHAIFYEDD
jgi:hypothetical protein